MSGRSQVFVTNDPHAMRINKELAQEIGFQESVVFLQLEYLISISDHLIDGVRWTRQTLEGLRDNHFPWWSTATISRVLHRLEERSLIVVGKHNRVGYDRTQWFAIDTEGAQELDSIAILQYAKSISHPADIEADRMQDGTRQNETTIPKTTKKDLENKSTNVLSPKPKKLKVADSEAESRWEGLLENDPNADLLQDFAGFRASENNNGEIKLATLWRQIGDEYSRAKLSSEALRYGLSEALRREKPSIRYALAVARNHKPGGSDPRPQRSIAIIGAKEEDYDLEGYRFHD